jgi:hypothetical protein
VRSTISRRRTSWPWAASPYTAGSPLSNSWATNSIAALEPLIDDFVFLSQITSISTARTVPPAPPRVEPNPLSATADVAENLGRIASGAVAVLAFLGSFG